jgi:hypothetical protein
MLYNRAMSQGIRMYCPDLYLMPTYTEGDEWTDKTDKNEVQETTFEVIEEKPAPKPIEIKNADVEFAKLHNDEFRNKKSESVQVGKVINKVVKSKVISEAQLNRLFAIMNKCELTKYDVKYYIAQKYKIFSSKDITTEQYDNIINDIESGVVIRFIDGNISEFELWKENEKAKLKKQAS